MHATTAGAGAHLLGFGQVKDEEESYEQRRNDRGGDRRRDGGRGRGGAGRGGERGAGGRGGGAQGRGERPPRQGGRKGARIVSNEDDFPTL